MAQRTLRIRRVGLEDLAAHRRLRLEMLAADPDAFWARREDVARWSDERWREDIRGPRLHLQARVGDEVQGGIAVLPEGYTAEHTIAPDEAILVSLWVRPAARGTGISTALLRGARDLAVSLGRPRLQLEVDERNTAARRMYERVGFRDTGRREPRDGHDSRWVEYMAHADHLALG
ncbi:GNAT family N-acetyltransferase [Brachybacterium huguangmaarense]|uniref:GNAT family N-acetyltransferase n=1 Tax=Brachybacterium huguangmaarense TaxID=1652028 RepID=A0ABY6FZW8_9MICO|nr:GNAT family N-acetyltransferase [Brachybacterium huguangmaarense]UYG16490.1 GNAT family N-acetyltransferase [Brachybacterium huguangmaarense]